MKAIFLIAASMIVGTAAIAQDATTNPDASASQPMTAPMPAATGVTTTASPPADTVAPPAPMDTSNYPPCSRTMHDRCVQTHEMARKTRPHG